MSLLQRFLQGYPLCVYDHTVFIVFLAPSDVVFKVVNVQDVMHHHTVTRGLIEEEASLDVLVLQMFLFCWLSHRFGRLVFGDKCGLELDQQKLMRRHHHL